MSDPNKGAPASSNSEMWPQHEDLRDLLAAFERMGELAHVEGADSHLELSALAETVTARYPGVEPALLFDNIPGYQKGFRILSGGANSYKRFAQVLGLPEPRNAMDNVRAYKARMKRSFEMTPPRVVETGPVLQNVWRDDEIDLTRFPAPFVHELDGGRYIGTEDLGVTRHPDSGWVNIGTYRIAVHSKNTVGIWTSPGKHGRMIRETYFARGEPCPIVISCGQDPLLFLCANAELPEGMSEYDYAGGQRGRPFDVIKSELYGLPFPAGSEIVLEGLMYPGDNQLEGPFGEFMGYYASEASLQPVVHIKRVYFRNDPIITMAIPSRPPSNFTVARSTVKSAMIWDECEKAGLAGIRGVWCHEAGAGRLFNVISIEQKYPGHAKQAGMLAANCQSGAYAGRWVVVVDHDIDPSNIHDVIWAMSTRCDPPNDIDYIRRAWSTPLDPMLFEPPWENNRAVVDACRPWGRQFPPVAEASPELKEQVMSKWPHLFP
ncbi:MAG TPA: UbiD family decarboxylase [Caulobacteraceae bacterium]|jgi:4-hydroxy-3-polyprenylbenzoate decarboxylase|nr:UbiD family decarboxylase [Caulobacteraceae bacterium]